MPTWDKESKSIIKWTTFRLHKDHPLVAKQCAFDAWDLTIEKATSSDWIALFATNDRSKNDLGSKNSDETVYDKELEHDKDSKHDPMSMLFQRLPGGVMKLCVQNGKAKPENEESEKEKGLQLIRVIAGLN